MNAIRLTGLTKYYGKIRGVDGIDLAVPSGEFFGFIGPNGAGKSTTIRTMLGLISPTSGSAEIFGMDVVKEKQAIQRKIGYLPSETAFYPGMRVKDALKLSADLRKMDCGMEAKRLCERLKLDPARKAEELSFGNRKKISIVCALQHCPELLILDEPTGGLDPLMQREFFDILNERNKQGTTVFLSSHVLSEIGRNCSRAAIIRDGKIIACDHVDALSQTNAKRITVRGKAKLDGLSGICDLKESEDSVSFLFGGDINELILSLSASRISDLTITEPEPEEIFLHYYKKEGDIA